MRALFLVLITTLTTSAGPHPWHYIKTHKEVLAADILTTVAMGMAYKFSSDCQRYPKYCVEDNGILPAHPSNLQLGGYVFGTAAGVVAANHLIWHYAPDKSARHILWIPNLAIEAGFAVDAQYDANAVRRVQACYRDGLCK